MTEELTYSIQITGLSEFIYVPEDLIEEEFEVIIEDDILFEELDWVDELTDDFNGMF